MTKINFPEIKPRKTKCKLCGKLINRKSNAVIEGEIEKDKWVILHCKCYFEKMAKVQARLERVK